MALSETKKQALAEKLAEKLYELAKEDIKDLMGHEVPEKDSQKIARIALNICFVRLYRE